MVDMQTYQVFCSFPPQVWIRCPSTLPRTTNHCNSTAPMVLCFLTVLWKTEQKTAKRGRDPTFLQVRLMNSSRPQTTLIHTHQALQSLITFTSLFLLLLFPWPLSVGGECLEVFCILWDVHFNLSPSLKHQKRNLRIFPLL